MFRFLQRVWRLAVDEKTGESALADRADPTVEKLLHRTIAAVDADVAALGFNTAIARMTELVNAAGSTGLTSDQMHRFVRILAPFAPHVAEEIWHRLGEENSVTRAAWPDYDEAMLKDDEVEIVVQVMGKVRSRITVPADADEKALEEAALADERIQKEIEGKTVRKVIVVPGRLVNVVAN
jgi:leucyl-tRNA synthetase